MKRYGSILAVILAATFFFAGCKSCKGRNESTIGTDKYPLIVGFMPSPDKAVMDENVKIVVDELSREGGLKATPVIARDFMSLIDGLANKTIDVAFINSLGYLLAHDWSNAEAIFQLKGEDGKMVYRSAIIAGANSGVKTIADITGKPFAFSDPFSLAGYLIPQMVFADNQITPLATNMAGGYSEVVEQVYNGKTPAGAIYYAERDPDGRIHDARLKLVGKYNDMLDKVLVIYKSDPVPTTPIVFRKDLSPLIKEKVVRAFEAASINEKMISALGKLYGATGIMPADPKSYDNIREILKKLGKDVTEVVPGAIGFYRTHLWDNVPSY